MKNISIEEFSNNIFELSEDSIYEVLEKFDNKQNIDKTLTYVFIKAFYLHTIKLFLLNHNKNTVLEQIYSKYKMHLSIYYKSNNAGISQELLNEILDAFDKSFEIIESLGFLDLENSYKFRHHIVISFELLRKILEKKSNSKIREDMFENYITTFQKESEKLIEYTQNLNIE